MKTKTCLTCIGTRPEIIKMAPVHKALLRQGHRSLILHTGQHGAVADELYDFFDMRPDYTIDLKRKSSSLAHLTSALLEGVDEGLRALDPDIMLVQGDTTSALAGAMIGYYHDKPVAHIEAGLRTFEREPFPEEKNREIIGRLAHWNFSPTRQARQNLLGEDIHAARIFEVGNTVIDAALWTRERILLATDNPDEMMPSVLSPFLAAVASRRLILVTAHRRENWGQPIRNIARAVGAMLARHGDTCVVWPVHPNAAVRSDVESEVALLSPAVRARICLLPPVGYQTMIRLLMQCDFTLTDSGGIQEEASAFAKPVLIARTSTERQELVQAGGATLVGTDLTTMTQAIDRLLGDARLYRSMQLAVSPFGDGQSGTRIADVISSAQYKDGVWSGADSLAERRAA
ncbi:MAG: UDP-N-acetylglucosamine 2-epimerase (non-hydrolyzing) [Herminiimonas sp.]|nr:UDP-N-acetylglucosamine 2-epimerase (non-hydrolyzing) [Herminiimonas sp.]